MSKDERKIDLVQVKINKKLIPLKGFIQQMLGNSIMGMLSALKGTQNAQEVEIKIKLSEEKSNNE